MKKIALLILLSWQWLAVVTASPTLLYNKLLNNPATIENVGLAGQYTYIVLKDLTYPFNEDYSTVLHNGNRYTVEKILKHTTRKDGVGDSYQENHYLLYLERQEGTDYNGHPQTLNNHFTIGDTVKLSIAHENSFESKCLSDSCDRGLAGNKAFFVTRGLNKPLLASYRYLYSTKNNKAFKITNIVSNHNRASATGDFYEKGATTFFINSTDITGLEDSFYLAGSHYANARMDHKNAYDNAAIISSFGLAGPNTYITLTRPQYTFDSYYDTINSNNKLIDILGLQIDISRYETIENGEYVTVEKYQKGSLLVYLPGTGYDFEVGQRIYLNETYENSALVKSRGLRNKYTYLEVEKLKHIYRGGV